MPTKIIWTRDEHCTVRNKEFIFLELYYNNRGNCGDPQSVNIGHNRKAQGSGRRPKDQEETCSALQRDAKINWYQIWQPVDHSRCEQRLSVKASQNIHLLREIRARQGSSSTSLKRLSERSEGKTWATHNQLLDHIHVCNTPSLPLWRIFIILRYIKAGRLKPIPFSDRVVQTDHLNFLQNMIQSSV